MKFTVKQITKPVILATAILLSACVITPDNHPNHSGHNNWNNNSYNYSADTNNNSISERAQNACFDRMGSGAQIDKISDLKPGWFEVIMINPNNGRKAACTVNQQGNIDEWHDM